MSSPYQWPELFLTEEDLISYNSVFTEAVKVHLPCENVEIVPSGIAESSLRALPEDWADGLGQVWKKGKPVVDHDIPRMYLPLWAEGKPYATAIITVGDDVLYQRHSIKSLLEFSNRISKDFIEIKTNGTDPLTGLLNNVLFWRGLTRLVNKAEMAALVVLEVYPRHKDAALGLSYLKRVGGSLRSMAGSTVPVFHLGSGTFAMFWRKVDADKAKDMADVVLHRLQIDGIVRCNMGLLQVEEFHEHGVDGISDLAWGAVVKARQRGFFARYTQCSPQELEKHPFRPLPVKFANRFKSLWRGIDRFAVATLSPEYPENLPDLEGLLSGLMSSDFAVVGSQQGTVSLLFKNCSGAKCLVQIEKLIEHLKKEKGMGVFAGVAEYPCLEHKRSGVPVNARKALRHAFYLGVGNAILLDSVSLNISGDVYYNEGDISAAIRDYDQGLAFDPGNINLLNSTGVAYAKLGAIRNAVGYFERALKVNAGDYMALYNLGSAWLAIGRDDLAVDYLEKAHKKQSDNFDLSLQLAGIYCRTGRFNNVVELLEDKGGDPGRVRGGWETGAAFRCLGEAWRKLGDSKKAIECLQKACVSNPRDARVLSMLGEVYDAEGQGGDIALDLCREALELDDSLWDNWYRLGVVKYRQGRYGSAISDLQKSLRLNRKNAEALEVLASIYEKMGKPRLSRQMREKEKKLINNK